MLTNCARRKPPYEVNPLYAFFFVSFLFLGVHLLLPLVLAIVVDSYKTQQKDVVSKDRVKERKGLLEAFVLLDWEKKGAIEFPTFERVMALHSPKMQPKRVRALWKALDQSQSNTVDLLEFLELCDILLLKFTKAEISKETVKNETLMTYVTRCKFKFSF